MLPSKETIMMPCAPIIRVGTLHSLRPTPCTCLCAVRLLSQGAGDAHKHGSGVRRIHDDAVVHPPVASHQLHQRCVGGRAAEGAHTAAASTHRCLPVGVSGANLRLGCADVGSRV